MESEWDWRRSAGREFKLKKKIKLKKEGKCYGIWKIWRAIRATKLKRKIR